ncbi:DUF3347 domain-containing protein [Chitinophaga sp. HK235]|uniref:DUF3347 domain-containing protein n=1 Tax=Chitinophaga sp. HK235 TaxID=2952571 RepID=UPI001BA50140|nr:DUF3347 domain-containing protein [Chitinophaga sp. HK235]
MKTIIISTLALTAITFAACNNQQATHEAQHTDSSAAAHHEAASAEKPMATIKPQFTDVNPTAAASIKAVVDGYLQLENGLAADDDAAAAKAGKVMSEALAKFDASSLTPEQQKIYVANKDDLKEHAEHISKNAGNIAHQREHFAEMSEDIYDLVKAFGGGEPLYHIHCPMYDNNKGAWWLSKSAEIKNPYMGAKMPTCGVVEQLIQ